MTNLTTSPMRESPPMEKVLFNDDLPTSSPSAKSTLIGIGCILGVIGLAVLYGLTIGF